MFAARVTGTSQDLFSVVMRAEERRLARDGAAVLAKGWPSGSWAEGLLHLAARGMSACARALPDGLMFRVHEAACIRLAHPYGYPYDRSEALQRACVLVEKLALEGRPPALLALTSHSPVRGPLAHMNFELVRHAGWALRSLRGGRGRPRLVIAVDPFALDTISSVAEALYAGFMGNLHLGLDRTALGRSGLSALALGPTAWPRMARRFFRALAAGGEAVMALAGGVETTTRVHYTAREWLAAGRGRAPLRSEPARVLTRLRERPAFGAFEAQHPEWLHPVSVWRRMEAWLMAVLEEPLLGGGTGPTSAERGVLAGPAREAAASILEAMGLGAKKLSEALADLDEEFVRETPYRRRFFRLLAYAVLAGGRPLVLLPVCHHGEESSRGAGVRPGEAWVWEGWSDGRILARSALGERWEAEPEEFAKRFVRENFR